MPSPSSRTRFASDSATETSGVRPKSPPSSTRPPSCTPSAAGIGKATVRIASPRLSMTRAVLKSTGWPRKPSASHVSPAPRTQLRTCRSSATALPSSPAARAGGTGGGRRRQRLKIERFRHRSHAYRDYGLEASGKVYNLKNLDDFNGNYTAAGGGVTAAGGAGAAVMKNQNGVTAELVATTQGVKFAIAAAGVEMKLK
jgi:hypothetical protein